jgi:uncharacterized protein YecE (DUF72 family)
MSKAELYVGTAGWSYKDWIDSFYPKTQSKTFDWLEYYSQYFNVVEVNSSYYTYLSQKVIEEWLNKVDVNKDFLFTIKLHRDFIEKRNFKSEHINSVQNNLNLLKNSNRLGGLLIQFPYSFEFTPQNANHIKELIDIFAEYEKFIEVRHKTWMIERFNNFLSKNKTTLCTIDMPHIGEITEFKPFNTWERLYIRLHGRNEKAWKQSTNNNIKDQTYEQQCERYNYLYSPGELTEIEYAIREVENKVKKIFVILINHPKGNSVSNAFELFHLLNDRNKVHIPQTTLSKFPRLSRISSKE